ncbi:hypothetical protein [Flavobacterium sp. 3HN19-14]|uniref:hypothetical protein n=1 Tax=Flavobacterium sp. 3HN19-14 TaxID=3448133 RepID=UPI003EE3235C
MHTRTPQEPIMGKYTKTYFIITFLIALTAAAYVSYGMFFSKPKTEKTAKPLG